MEVLKSAFFLLIWFSSNCNRLIFARNDTENSGKIDIDEFINNYVTEVKRTLRLGLEEHNIRKRSADIDVYALEGLELLVGFQDMFFLPTQSATDIVLFSQCPSDVHGNQAMFAATLESLPNHEQVNELVLYRYQDETWVMKDRVEVLNGIRLATEQIGDFVYIIVAEYNRIKNRNSPVYLVSSTTNKLQFVQMLINTHYASQVVMWKWEDMEAFAAVAIAENPPGVENRFSTYSPVYRWMGSHFDMIDALPSHNPRALTQFNIRSSLFIAIANFQNDLGETSVESEIYRFNIGTQTFDLYQKLPTEAAVDVKYFCFESSQNTESFLIFSSAFYKDEEGKKNYNAASVVYKLSDEEYFIPFQALQVSKVTSWLPVRHTKEKQDSLVLLAATEEGVASFQYDGWRFVSTGLLYDRSSFGPGLKSMRAFYLQGHTFIASVSEHATGGGVSLFSPVFKPQTSVEDIQRELVSWEQRVTQQLAADRARLATLTRSAQAAPSINDPVVHLGTNVIFHQAQIQQVETMVTKVEQDHADLLVNNQLLSLDILLQKAQTNFENVKNGIDQLSFHTLTRYRDTKEYSADIQCTPSCHAQQALEVEHVNTENFYDFIKNTVNIDELVHFEDDVLFEELALIDPLVTRTINGHPADSVVDWSKEVFLPHGLKVGGDVAVQEDLTVNGKVNGVAINIESRNEDDNETGSVSSTKYIETLNASKLILSDGTLSEVDFDQFHKTTLKTEGDQEITTFQDYERIEADELVVKAGMYKIDGVNIPPSPFQKKQPSSEGPDYDSDQDASSQENIILQKPSENIRDSTNFIDGVMIVQDDLILGEIIIQNGSLIADDFVDLKHNVSPNIIMQLGISLNKSVIESHVKFNTKFKTPTLNVDTLNGVDPSDLVNSSTSEPVILTGRKEFQGNIMVEGTIQVNNAVNGVNITSITPPGEQAAGIQIENLQVERVNSDHIKIREKDVQHIVTVNNNGAVYLKYLDVEEDLTTTSVMVRGRINEFILEQLLGDTVYDDGNVYHIVGEKHFIKGLIVRNVTLGTTFNNIDLKTVIPDEIVWEKLLSEAKIVKVDNLSYKGLLDGIQAGDFGSWLLTEGEQTIDGLQVIDSLQVENAMVPPKGTINSVNIHKLIRDAVFINKNVTLENIVFDEPVSSSNVKVGGRMSGLQVPGDFVLAKSVGSQWINAEKRIYGSLIVEGNLHPTEQLNAVNLTGVCRVIAVNNSKLVMSGNTKFKEEPSISDSINGNKWTDLMERVWFREDSVNIIVPLLVYRAQFENLHVENINNNNLDKKLSKLVSLSQDESIFGTFYFQKITTKKGLEGEAAMIGGNVQGIHLQSFVKNVLLDGENQTFSGVPDFHYLTVDGVLLVEGLVNSMNLSRDVVLLNVPSNNISSSLSLFNLRVGTLTVPPDVPVGGVDLHLWNKTVLSKSTDNVITGDLVFLGKNDFASGIRIEGLLNGLIFDKQQIMLLNESQKVTGVKTFSNKASLNIKKLDVGGHINAINITEFYNQQVTTSGNSIISGRKVFSAPLYCERAQLPEIYQGYNLSELEGRLAKPLPWRQMATQLAAMAELQQLALTSITGKSHFLRNITKVEDLKGVVLHVFPLKTHNLTVLGVIKSRGEKTILSFLHWSDEYSSFIDMPGTFRHVLQTAPTQVQSVLMPHEELGAYVTFYSRHKSSYAESKAVLFTLKNGQIDETSIDGGKPGSQLLSFRDNIERTCFIVVSEKCHVYCLLGTKKRARLPSFSCTNVTEASVVTTAKGIYVLGLQRGLKNVLLIWRLSGKTFSPVLAVNQFNSVSLAATATPRGVGVAIATRHLVGHSQPESIHIYRFNEETVELEQTQRLAAIAPRQVLFARLPSGESAVYVASDNPASPLVVFLYRGVLGYQLFALEDTLPTPMHTYAFTDHRRRHFLLVNSPLRSSVLEAQFEAV